MTRKMFLSPAVDEELSGHGRRIRALEDLIADPAESIDPAHVNFDMPGPLVAIESNEYAHPQGGRLVRARMKLKIAGSSDVTVVFRKNGTIFDPVQTSGGALTTRGEVDPGSYFVVTGAATIPAGQRLGVVFFTGARFSPDVDELTVEVTATGTDAAGLLIRTDWTL